VSLTAAAAAAVAVAAAVKDEDDVQWWRRGGAFNGGGSVRRRRRWGLRIGDDESTMEIDISSGGWRWWASAFDSGDGRRWALAFNGGNGDGRQLWQRWTIETAFDGDGGGGVQWRQQGLTARAAQGQATQQTSQHDERTRGWCNERTTRDDDTTSS
jgi:hypothetical protein